MKGKMAYRKLVIPSMLICVCLASAASGDVFGTGDNQFTVDFVSISGSTNPTSGRGIVSYDYRMGTYEVTRNQWDKYVASVGSAPTGLPSTAYDGGTTGSGARSVGNVSWYEAARFVNWLNTSSGNQAAYKFNADGSHAIWDANQAAGGTNLFRHKDAKYYLPTENEWFKAAYWNQTDQELEVFAMADGSPNTTNWNFNSVRTGPWDVGSGGVAELNGTYDMMGNSFEWVETPYWGSYNPGGARQIIGGGYASTGPTLSSNADRTQFGGEAEINHLGLRVASVPEPATLGLLAMGGIATLLRKKRK